MKSDDAAINKLVSIANADPSSRAGKKAIEKLHGIKVLKEKIRVKRANK